MNNVPGAFSNQRYRAKIVTKCQADVANRSSVGETCLKTGGVSCYGVLIPLQSDAWHVGYMKRPVLDIVRFQQNRIGPILPLKPVGGLRDPHDMRGDLGIKMT
jgi:hypothetical protein